jgi:NAD+ diphosphatase
VDEFVALLLPPDTPAISGTLWFHVRGNQVRIADSAAPGIGATHFLGMLGTVACWAVDADGADLDVTAPPADAAAEPDGFVDLRLLWGQVPDVQWTVAGRAVQFVEWGRTHRYCGRCGTPTEPAPGERAMRCPSCGLLAFPRLAPAVIVLVSRGEEALLARGRLFPIAMYSCLAGFVEPGETLEQAVRREVREEVGIELDELHYQASQPWPFPHSLMIGWRATWASGEITVDETEIVDAAWYRREDLPTIPPRLSIARALIDGWLAEG